MDFLIKGEVWLGSEFRFLISLLGAFKSDHPKLLFTHSRVWVAAILSNGIQQDNRTNKMVIIFHFIATKTLTDIMGQNALEINGDNTSL